MPPKASAAKTSILKRPAAAPVKSEEEHEDDDEEEEEEDEEVAKSAPPTPQQPSGQGRGRGRGTAAVATSTPQQTSPAPQESTPKAVAPSPKAVASPPGSASRGSDAALVPKEPEYTGPRRLTVSYELPDDVSGAVALGQGLVRLRRANQLCDATVVAAGGRIPVHRVVLAAQSDTLAARLQTMDSGTPELQLESFTFDAVDLVVRWLYGEIAADSYVPVDAKLNEEVLRLAAQLGLHRLAELCALQLAADADVSNVVAHVQLCEEFGLPRLRSKLVASVLADGTALASVASDPATLRHPALMRELLAAIALKASNDADDESARNSKRLRTKA